ncbi:MAG: LBF_2804 family protein, partial [Chitinophagaceae bacterium]
LLFILKATLTNFIFRFFIQRVMGRYLVRAIQDFAGIPIFAFWNAYGTRTILKEARVIILGQNLIEVLMNRIKITGGFPEEKKSLISDTMQYIAISKRDFHQNHFLLTRNLFELFGIEERVGHWEEKKYIEDLKAADQIVRNQCLFIILLGDILDGKISSRERFKLKKLRDSGLLNYSDQEMKKIAKDFLDGRGIEPLLQKYLD